MMKQKRRVVVLDSYISYVDTRAGEELVVLLHGNLTSSGVWDHLIRRMSGVARCIAPDLLGMGDSGKHPQRSYTFMDQYRYFSAWIDSLKLHERIIFVCQDIGSILAFHWASQNEAKVKAIVYVEGVVAPFGSYDDLGALGTLYKSLRNDKKVEEEAKKDSRYLEKCLAVMGIPPAALKSYVAPISNGGDACKPMIDAIKSLPITGEGPEDVIQIVDAYSSWLSTTEYLPKLLVKADPGVFTPFVEKATSSWPNQITVTAKGGHLVQEASPDKLGDALVVFIRSLEQLIS